jgi:hypothetical protein
MPAKEKLKTFRALIKCIKEAAEYKGPSVALNFMARG